MRVRARIEQPLACCSNRRCTILLVKRHRPLPNGYEHRAGVRMPATLAARRENDRLRGDREPVRGFYHYLPAIG